MVTPNATVRYTAEQLLTMPGCDTHHELVAGRLRVMEPASGMHGLVVGRIFAALAPYVHGHGLGDLFTEATGFQLRRDPDTVRAPDIAFVRTGRLPPDGIGSGFLDLAPDLAVEVVSPGDTVPELGEKLDEYFDVGVHAVWVADPMNRTITVHEARHTARTLREGDVLSGGLVLPGFACEVAALFAGVRRS
ncbi:MAG: Uma2 family endonuclease [Gemmatimonadaceae bacterium]